MFFLLPNHETYFDLILLEVLSIGVPVILSSTGGNKYFKKFGKEGLLFYKTIDDAIENINNLKATTGEYRHKIGLELVDLFESEFSVAPFTKRYVETISGIANEEKR